MSVRALSGASPRLVTWGSGSFGAVGDGTYQTRAVPAVVELPDPVTHAHASAGTHHQAGSAGGEHRGGVG